MDNRLLDNDRIQDDLKRHLEREFGAASRDRYWAILEELFVELGYRDYLGALQRYRTEHPQDVRLMAVSSVPGRLPVRRSALYPGALDILQRFRVWGPTVILSDGDVVFQPRKVERSGIAEAVDRHVLIYIHKQTLESVERRYPAQHYVLVDDKPRILAAVKDAWGDRVTTISHARGRALAMRRPIVRLT